MARPYRVHRACGIILKQWRKCRKECEEKDKHDITGTENVYTMMQYNSLAKQ